MRFHLALIIAVAFGAFTGPAEAQDVGTVTEDARAATRALADKGSERFEAGAYEEALQAFRDADQRIAAPTIRLMIARTYDKLGRLHEARDAYQLVLDEKLAYYAPPAFFEAQKNAKEELARLIKRIPTMRFVVLTGPRSPVTKVQVTVDGAPVDPSRTLTWDPGTYEVIARAPGRHPVTRSISLKEGSAEEVTLELGPAQPQPPVKTAPGGSPPARELSDAGLDPLLFAGITGSVLLTGLGVSLAAVGISKGNEADEVCPDDSCRPGDAGQRWMDLEDDRVDLLNGAVWSFIGAGLVGLGTVGYAVWAPRSPSSPSVAVRGYSAGGGLAVAGKW